MPGPVHCGLLAQAPLLPRLRGCFAEFLDNASPAGLRILSSPTCVGLRYGPRTGDSGFSRRRPRVLGYSIFAPRGARPPAWVFPPCRAFPPHRSFHSRHTPCRRVPAVLLSGGAGMFTCCPSGAPCGLPLGPDFPRADQLHPGNLGYSAWRIRASISLLIPAFSLPAPPPPLAGRLRRRQECSPTDAHTHPTASAACFSPGHFRRGDSRPVSCYALFERVAASGPTSWLSLNPHILSHLTRTWGP